MSNETDRCQRCGMSRRRHGSVACDGAIFGARDCIERLFKQHGHRLKTAMERLNALGGFEGQVFEACDEWGWELMCPTWGATATFADAHEYGDADETGRMANITVFCAAQGGQLLPSFVPLNYTADVWCDLSDSTGEEELLTRLDDLEGSLEEFASSITERLGELAVAVTG